MFLFLLSFFPFSVKQIFVLIIIIELVATMNLQPNSLAKTMKQAAVDKLPFTDSEIDKVVKSIQNLTPPFISRTPSYTNGDIDWNAFRQFVTTFAYDSHKDWIKTELASRVLESLVSTPDDPRFQDIFHRVLIDGNWPGAQQAAAFNADKIEHKPWIVLVTGLNGIRKTTSTQQPWFAEAVRLSLENWDEKSRGSTQPDGDDVPCGANSFFRQLDYIIATVANEEFKTLYQTTTTTTTTTTTSNNVKDYSLLKDAIFARYRTIAEVVGVLLIKAAMNKKLNVMVETSGRDIAMFEYVDTFFPDNKYRKMVVHFSVNEITFAEKSVDLRMQREMLLGAQAVAAEGSSARDIVAVNSGGPYGSSVLAGVEADSNKVWTEVRSSAKYDNWHKASLYVQACDSDSSGRDRWSVSPRNGQGNICGGPYYFTR